MIQKKIVQAIEGSQRLSKGFGLFHDDEADKCHVYFLSEAGKLLLLSKPYSTERNCENALNRFREGKFSGSVQKDEQGYYLDLKSESGKPVASSPTFPNEAAATAALKELQKKEQAAASAAKPKAEKKTAAKPAKAKTKAVEAKTEAPPRHTFRLVITKADKEQPLRGRIEYSLTQEGASFQGLDMGAVRSFITEKIEETRLAKPMAPPVEGGQILFLEKGQAVQKTVLSAGKAVDVELQLDLDEAATYDAFVYAKSLESHQKVMVGRISGKKKPIRLSIYLNAMVPGLFRLTATVQATDESGRTSADYYLESALFHFIPKGEVAAWQ